MIDLNNKKEDLRVRRTYKLLSQALMSLLLEKSFEEIFVTDICDRAMVHRTTFYKHFEDKYHLLDFCVKELVHTFEEDSDQLKSSDNMKEYYMGLIRKSLMYMMDNKKLFLTGIIRSGNVLPMLQRSIYQLVESKLIENEKIGLRHMIPVSIIAQFYSGALLTSAIWWLENDTPVPLDDMIHYISLMISETGYIAKE